MQRLFLLLLVLASAVPAGAHVGNENNTEIRVYADSMRVILRTSIPFAWSLLGGNAPPMADEAGQAIAKPLLVAATPGLVTLTAAGKPMKPTQVDCQFEVENDVAFILNFKRPAEWPVEVRMEFFDRLGNLETGTIAVFDYTASRFARDVEPLAQKVVDRSNPSLAFTLMQTPPAAQPVAAPPPPPQAAPPGKADGTRRILVFCLMLIGVTLIGILAYRRIQER